MAKKPVTMTTAGGNPVADNRNSITHDITRFLNAVSR